MIGDLESAGGNVRSVESARIPMFGVGLVHLGTWFAFGLELCH